MLFTSVLSRSPLATKRPHGIYVPYGPDGAFKGPHFNYVSVCERALVLFQQEFQLFSVFLKCLTDFDKNPSINNRSRIPKRKMGCFLSVWLLPAPYHLHSLRKNFPSCWNFYFSAQKIISKLKHLLLNEQYGIGHKMKNC